MNKKTKFALTTAWILFSRSYDAYSTNLLTPDLSKEANPLVSVLGIKSWSSLLIILSILTIYVLYAFAVSVFKPIPLHPQEKGYSLGQFSAYLYLGRPAKWTAILYQFPKDGKRLTHYLGHVLTPCLSIAGLVSTLMWLLIHHSEYYRSIHSAPAIYFILVCASAFTVWKWNQTEFQKYQKATLNV